MKFKNFEWENANRYVWQSCLYLNNNIEHKLYGQYRIIKLQYDLFEAELGSEHLEFFKTVKEAQSYCNNHWHNIMSLYIIED